MGFKCLCFQAMRAIYKSISDVRITNLNKYHLYTHYDDSMSLGFVVKVPEGLVLAAESRVTLAANDEQGRPLYQATYDNATKLLSFSPPHNYIGVVTYGQAVIGGRTAYGYLTEFDEQLPKGRISVQKFAEELYQFFKSQWDNAEKPPGIIEPMVFLIAGFDEKEVYGRVYQIRIPEKAEPEEQNPGTFGISYGGDIQIVHRLVNGFDYNVKNLIESIQIADEQKSILLNELSKLQLPIPYPVLSLQDSVDLAILFIQTTIKTQKLAILPRSCGGPIDVCTITRKDGLKYIQCKEIKGEEGHT